MTAALPTFPTSSTILQVGRRVDIAARQRIQPFAQGEFDCLCGLYSAINAIRLARASVAPLTYPQCRALFIAGIEFLAGQRAVKRGVMWGMDLSRRLALADHLAREASDRRCAVAIEPAPYADWVAIDDCFAWIEASIAAQQPVLVHVDGRQGPSQLDHYTVIAGVGPASLALFDAGSPGLIRKSSCAMHGGRYRLTPESLLRVTVKPPG